MTEEIFLFQRWFLLGGAFVLGAIIGSFLNVVIHRLPRDESLVSPGSRCPHCHTPIPPWLNIPIASYLMLRGRCRVCRRPIGVRYPLVETANALLYLGLALRFGLSLETFVMAAFTSALLAVTFIDLDLQIIPDAITLPGMAAGLAASLLLPLPLWESLAALLLGGGFFYTAAVLSKGGMGGGDIKLAAMMGAFLGIEKLVLAVFLGLLSGSAVAVVLMIMGRKSRKDVIPFGPFLALGGTAAVFWGEWIISWYLAANLL